MAEEEDQESSNGKHDHGNDPGKTPLEVFVIEVRRTQHHHQTAGTETQEKAHFHSKVPPVEEMHHGHGSVKKIDIRSARRRRERGGVIKQRKG